MRILETLHCGYDAAHKVNKQADIKLELARRISDTFLDADDRIFINEPMSYHSTFRVGGPADILFSVRSVRELAVAICSASALGIQYTVLGNGSNILVADKGIRGLVVLLGKDLSEISEAGNSRINAQAGALLSAVSKYALSRCLTGLEFAGGIPGTIGGALYMNAGAYGGCISDVVLETEAYDTEMDRVVIFEGTEDHGFGYRKSVFEDGRYIAINTLLQLNEGNRDQIECLMSEYSGKRKNSQPLDLPSAGSTFKRPVGYFAGKLIEDAGLKGYRIGGASVSTKHAGFIVNDKGASASDVIALIKHVQDTVFKNSGVMLETEVRILGDW